MTLARPLPLMRYHAAVGDIAGAPVPRRRERAKSEADIDWVTFDKAGWASDLAAALALQPRL